MAGAQPFCNRKKVDLENIIRGNQATRSVKMIKINDRIRMVISHWANTAFMLSPIDLTRWRPMRHQNWILPAILFSFIVLLSFSSTVFSAEKSLVEAVTDGKFIANIRIRYEFVDQDGFSKDANAKTTRARLGYQTGTWYGISALAEIDGTTHLGDDEFNSKENGETSYPVVVDPDSFRLNRANLKYTGVPDTVIKGGRQRIILDDARFVGNVGWRQNEQTFDAVRITNKSIDGLAVNYAYVWQVNSILGSETALGDYASNSHFLDVTVSSLDFLDVTAFGHWLDFEDAKEASSLATYGLRAGGKTMVSEDTSVLYAATFAHQEDHGDNSSDISENYYSAMGGVGWNGFTAKVGYDVFEGNGTVAFQTPLATGHKFQGFADVFLTTPADGLENFHISVNYKSKPFAFLSKGVSVTAAWHDFEAENSSTDMGSEFDAVVAVPLYDNFKIVTKYANYDGDGFAADRQKFMFGINFNY